MLLSEFSRASGLPPDTVRFYVRRGLLVPTRGEKGGQARYQVFTREHMATARHIRLAQSLGFTLREIAAFNAEYRAEGVTAGQLAAVFRERLRALDEKAAQIDALRAYMKAKLQWLEGGRIGPEPRFEPHARRAAGTGQ